MSSWSAGEWLLAVEEGTEEESGGEGLSWHSHCKPSLPSSGRVMASFFHWYLERKAWNSCSLEAEAALSSSGSKALVKSMARTCLWKGRRRFPPLDSQLQLF